MPILYIVQDNKWDISANAKKFLTSELNQIEFLAKEKVERDYQKA